MKTNAVKRSSKLSDALYTLKGNNHFIDFLSELDIICGYQKTIFEKDNVREDAFKQGRQSVANLIHKKLDEIEERKED